MTEPVGGAVLAGLSLGGDECLDVRLILNDITTTEGPGMAGDHLVAVQDADLVQGGHDQERALHLCVGDRVVVAVEPRVRRLADAHLKVLVGGKGPVRQGQQMIALSSERLCHRARSVLGTASRVGDLPGPGQRLGVEVGDIGECPGLEE